MFIVLDYPSPKCSPFPPLSPLHEAPFLLSLNEYHYLRDDAQKQSDLDKAWIMLRDSRLSPSEIARELDIPEGSFSHLSSIWEKIKDRLHSHLVNNLTPEQALKYTYEHFDPQEALYIFKPIVRYK